MIKDYQRQEKSVGFVRVPCNMKSYYIEDITEDKLGIDSDSLSEISHKWTLIYDWKSLIGILNQHIVLTRCRR